MLLGFFIASVTLLAQAQDEEEMSLLDKARTEYNQKNYNYAAIYADKAIEADPEDTWPYLIKARIEFERNGPVQAIAEARRAMMVEQR